MLVYFINHSSAVDHLGGSERSLFKLIEDWMLIDPDFVPHFITKSPRGLVIDELEKRGWTYTALTFRGWAVPPHDSHPDKVAYFAADDYLATSQIVSEMEERRPDLVVTNTLVAPWGAFAAKTLGIPHVWMVREYGDSDHGLVFIQGRERTLSDIGLLSELVLANSRAVLERLATAIPRAKLSIVYPTVDPARMKSLAEADPGEDAFPGRDNELKIIVVGRLAPSKGQWRALEALGILSARGVQASLCLVGASMMPGYDTELMARASALGVEENFRVLGERENPFPYIRQADVCVTPSDQEAFGRATLEYLSLGKPVVATATGGSVELVTQEVNGFLFSPDDPSELANHLERYATDRQLLDQHGRASASRAAELGDPAVGNQGAIARMTALVGMPAYSLPEISRMWFAIASSHAPDRGPRSLRWKYHLQVLRSRSQNFLKDPVGSSCRKVRLLLRTMRRE